MSYKVRLTDPDSSRAALKQRNKELEEKVTYFKAVLKNLADPNFYMGDRNPLGEIGCIPDVRRYAARALTGPHSSPMCVRYERPETKEEREAGKVWPGGTES